MNKTKELNKKNNEMDELLSKKNQDVMIDMISYLRVAPISDYQVELVRQDILDMALGAERRNEPLSKTFGDYKGFCDDIVDNLKKQGKAKNIFSWIMYLVIGGYTVLAAIDVVFSGYLIKVFKSIYSHSKVDLMYPITLGFILSTVSIMAASYIIVYEICKNSFQIKSNINLASKLKRFLLGACIGAVFCGYVFLLVKFSKIVLFSVNIFIYAGIIAALFIIYKVYKE